MQISARFDADSDVISIKTQGKEIEMKMLKPQNGFTQAQKLHFYFYLTTARSVKKGDKKFTRKINFSAPLTLNSASQ